MSPVRSDRPSEPLILALDTTTDRGSVAVSRGRSPLALLGATSPATHSRTVVADIDYILKRIGATIEDVNLFAVACGPGSFTGVRVGLATAKGFAHALGRPAVGVTTLEALAYAAPASGIVCASVDALRGETYVQLFRITAEGVVTSLRQPEVMPARSFLLSLSEPDIVFVGDGVPLLLRAAEQDSLPLTPCTHLPLLPKGWIAMIAPPLLAPAVAALAYQRWHSGAVMTGLDLHPVYVRPSDAEARRAHKQSPLVRD
jgi:tRNA threonylcarbamoyladenosine biosynthesis protein TsaB